MQVLLEVLWWFVAEILVFLIAFIVSAAIGTPFILIAAAFENGTYLANISARYRGLWDWWSDRF